MTGTRSARGYVTLMAVIALTVLLVLALTLLAIGANARGHSMRQVREAQALAAAEAACSRGLVMLEQGAITSVPYQELNIPIGRRRMDLRVVGISPSEAGAYEIQRYEIRGTGYSGNVQRTVGLGGRHDSFLRYSRFLETGGISYGPGAHIYGQLYAGGDLNMSGATVTFYDDVTVTGSVNNRSRGVFHGSVVEHASPISLNSSMNLTQYRTWAQQAGLYYSSTGTTSIDLSLFDLTASPPTYNGSSLGANFNGIIYAAGDLSVKGVLEGRSLTLVAASDIIVANDVRTGCSKTYSATVSPELSFNAPAGVETVQTASLTSLLSGVGKTVHMRVRGAKWQRLNLYVYESGALLGVATLERPSGTNGNYVADTILSGLQMDPNEHTYMAEVHYWSNGPASEDSSGHGMTFVGIEVAGGNPVNIGLLAKDYCYISQYAPRVLTIDAAVFARDQNWRPQDSNDGNDSDGSHVKRHGVWDLDQDGQIESPNEDGWNEANVGDNTWMLNINGPIITKNGGSAGAWESQGSSQNKGTRHYNYDYDIVYYEPPAFPVMLSQWAVLYWREL